MKTYLSVGIGDMMRIDSFLTQEERNNISEIYWACRFGKHMSPLFDNNKYYPNLVSHYFIEDETGRREMSKFEGHAVDFWHFRPDFPANFNTGLQLFNLDRNDLFVIDAFAIFNDASRQFNNSSFLECAKTLPPLYNNYILVHYPTSTRPRSDIARMEESDWSFIRNFAKEKGLQVVVVTDSEINTEAGEMVVLHNPDIRIVPQLCVHAAYYMGCDSFISILCSKIFEGGRMFVKSHQHNINDFVHSNWAWRGYYAPHDAASICGFYRNYIGY